MSKAQLIKYKNGKDRKWFTEYRKVFNETALFYLFASRNPLYFNRDIYLTRISSSVTFCPCVFVKNDEMGGKLLAKSIKNRNQMCIPIFDSTQCHSSLLWINKTTRPKEEKEPKETKESNEMKGPKGPKGTIERYDPHYSNSDKYTKVTEDQIKNFIAKFLPHFEYKEYSTPKELCIQRIRNKKGDYFCEEYCILYALRRMNGLSHSSAVEDLFTKRETIINEIEAFYASM